MPVLPLDRIYAFGPALLRDVQVYRSPLARLASDHLPLVATLSWTNLQPPRGRESWAVDAPKAALHAEQRLNAAIGDRPPAH
jgi:hypothetical protein